MPLTLPMSATSGPRPFRLDPPRAVTSERIRILPALSAAERAAAAQLIGRRYAWRGYQAVGLPDVALALEQRRHTLIAVGANGVVGTLTIGIDGPAGLNCEQLFAAPVAALRARGQRLCEFTRLAVEASADESRQVLAALFHAAYRLAQRLGSIDRLLVEVHPRHARFYERRFGAEVLGSDDHHPGVGAPAVLLTLSLAEVEGRLRASEAGDRRATGRLGLPSWPHGPVPLPRVADQVAPPWPPEPDAPSWDESTGPAPWQDGLGLPPFNADAAARARIAPGWRS